MPRLPSPGLRRNLIRFGNGSDTRGNVNCLATREPPPAGIVPAVSRCANIRSCPPSPTLTSTSAERSSAVRCGRLTPRVPLVFLPFNRTYPLMPRSRGRMRRRPVHVRRRLSSLGVVIVMAALLASVAPASSRHEMARSSLSRDGFRLPVNSKSLSSGSTAAGCVRYEQAWSLHTSLSGRRTVAGFSSAAAVATTST